MRRWIPILSVCCVVFASTTAAAAVRFQGLQYTAQGTCAIDALTDGLLLLSNIGSSGQDGVSVSCLHMDGVRLAFQHTCTSADDGAHLAMTYRWTLISQPAASRATLVSFTVSAPSPGSTGFVDISTSVGELSSSPTCVVTLSRGGLAVYRATVPASTVARVAFPSSGLCPTPTLYCSVDRKVHGLHHGAELPQVARVTVAGHDEDCDDVDFSSALDPDDDDCDGVSCDLRVTSPPGSSFSSVSCASGSCEMFDHFEQGKGPVEMSVSVDASGRRRLHLDNLGSSGQDGVELRCTPEGGGGGGGGGAGGGGECASSLVFSSPSLHIDPAVDHGASCAISVVGEGFAGAGLPPVPVSSSVTLTVTGSNFACVADHSGMGADVESVVVYRRGVEVGRCAMPPGASMQVAPPPGGSPDCRVVAYGYPRAGYDVKANKKVIPAGVLAAQQADAAMSAGKGLNAVNVRRAFEVALDRDRTFSGGGWTVVGDRVLIFGGCSSGSCSSSSGGHYSGDFKVVIYALSVVAPPGSSLTSLDLVDVAEAGAGDAVAAQVPSSSSLSSASSCVRVPFTFERTDVTGVRAFSVTFHLSSELSVCGSGVLEGDYLSSVAGTQMFVTGNGGSSYTVDCSILGPVCGATGGGTLFTLDVGAAGSSAGTPPPDGLGEIVVDAVTVRDCSNATVPGEPGASAFLPVDFTAPSGLGDLSALQVKTGNGTGGTTGIALSWSPPEPLASVALFCKGFGGYPLYDDAGGAPPSPPASAAAALASGWVPASVVVSSGHALDSEHTRDYLYFAGFVTDAAGNSSPVSNMTTGTLDYHLGDVSDGVHLGQGNNVVDLDDISLLGSHYGVTLASPSPFSYLDVGPTTDFSVDGRPLTDHRVEFEDFVVFAMNFATVSRPQYVVRPTALAANAARLVAPELPAPGGVFDVAVEMDGTGEAQALSVRLDYDHAILEQVGVAPGALLGEQGRQSTALTSGPGDVDVALLGTGPGIAGRGPVATVSFRVKAAGDPRLGIAQLVARDAGNRDIAVAADAGHPAIASRTGLGMAAPNPFRETTALQLGLRAAGAVRVAVYDVAGRRVRTLLDGVQPAGIRSIRWDGRDDSGLRMAPGAYVVRFAAQGLDETRTIRLVR